MERPPKETGAGTPATRQDMGNRTDGWENVPFRAVVEDGVAMLVPDRPFSPDDGEFTNDLIEALRLERDFRNAGPHAPCWWLEAISHRARKVL